MGYDWEVGTRQIVEANLRMAIDELCSLVVVFLFAVTVGSAGAAMWNIWVGSPVIDRWQVAGCHVAVYAAIRVVRLGWGG